MQKPIKFDEVPGSADRVAHALAAENANEDARKERVNTRHPRDAVKRRDDKIIDTMARDLLEQNEITPPASGKINEANRKMEDGTRPSLPVHKTAGLVYPDGGGMGPLPPPKPIPEERTKQRATTRQEAARRMEICKNCPELMAMDRCRRCGCFMRVKTHIPMARCPLLKW